MIIFVMRKQTFNHNMSTNNPSLLRAADNIRILAAAMVEKSKSGHPGGAMGGADFIALLYAEFLRYDPRRMDYPLDRKSVV